MGARRRGVAGACPALRQTPRMVRNLRFRRRQCCRFRRSRGTGRRPDRCAQSHRPEACRRLLVGEERELDARRAAIDRQYGRIRGHRASPYRPPPAGFPRHRVGARDGGHDRRRARDQAAARTGSASSVDNRHGRHAFQGGRLPLRRWGAKRATSATCWRLQSRRKVCSVALSRAFRAVSIALEP